MTVSPLLLANLGTVTLILVTMAASAFVETVLPLHARGAQHRAHLGPNLALTFMTFATNMVFNSALVLALAGLQAHGFGLLPQLALPPLVSGAIAVVALDFSFYVAHVAMHAIPSWWRVHRVHHSDPVLDVTTTIRQHPLEGVIRYAFMAVAATTLGVTATAFAVYRVWSALTGLLEHANIRLPQRLDSLLVLIVTTPNMHKVHHSRLARETDSNYGNIFSLFDRLFSTLTPPARGVDVVCGLDGFDDAATQTTAGLLALPFRALPALAGPTGNGATMPAAIGPY